jgi:hypothetical protein
MPLGIAATGCAPSDAERRVGAVGTYYGERYVVMVIGLDASAEMPGMRDPLTGCPSERQVKARVDETQIGRSYDVSEIVRYTAAAPACYRCKDCST